MAILGTKASQNTKSFLTVPIEYLVVAGGGSGGSQYSFGAGCGGAMSSPGGVTNSGAGGSGVVVLAYQNTYPTLTISGGLTYTEPSRSGYRVYRFTAGTGTVTF